MRLFEKENNYINDNENVNDNEVRMTLVDVNNLETNMEEAFLFF